MNHRTGILTLMFFCCFSAGEGMSQVPSDLVYPFLDAANSRWFYFSSASRPFGMVSLSPDTETNGDWRSGYVYDTHEIKGFSHLHDWQVAGLSVMPIVSKRAVIPTRNDYFSGFRHENEVAFPGYHSVFLERYGIQAELTSTLRAGFHRYRFPAESTPKILINLDDPLGPVNILGGEIRRVSNRELKGHLVNSRTVRRPKPVKIYFHIMLDRDVEQIDGWKGLAPEYKTKRISGDNIGMILTLAQHPDTTVLMKVGISYVSERQAKLNLETEISHWDFDRVVGESRNEWNAYLGRIRVEGGSDTTRIRFYTDLWKALQGRRIISDVNGKYADHTGPRSRIRQIPLDENRMPEFNHFHSDAFWGTQWNLNILWHLVYPDVTSQFCNSLLLYYRDGGLIPRGPSAGMYTFVMTGASTTPFIVSAWQKGIRDFDIETAYDAMVKNHMPGGLMSKAGYEHGTSVGGGIENYIRDGFVPYPYEKRLRAYHLQGAGQTLEYAYQDWALAQLAKALGRESDEAAFMKRSENWKNLWDPRAGFFVPLTRRGLFIADYDPYEYADGFVESNSAQATWYVPHDIPSLAQLMGGNDSLVSRLNRDFEIAQQQGFTAGRSHEQEEHPLLSRTPINYGNQPSLHTAFIFNLAGAPHLTQKWSRAVIDSVYSQVSPYHGYRGDEDQGQMGALAVLMKIGLFQVDGGCAEDPLYQIGSPVFDRIEIDLHPDYYPGGRFVISGTPNSGENIYIHSLKLNGEVLTKFEVKHSEITSGGVLEMER